MRIKLEIDPSLREAEVTIRAPKVTDEVLLTQRMLETKSLIGYREGEVIPLSMSSLLRIYTEDQRIFAQTADGVYQLRQRMYMLEELLDKSVFLRISNAEIVNSRAILRMDLSVSGTIGVELQGGIRTFASRRYVKKIREFFRM